MCGRGKVEELGVFSPEAQYAEPVELGWGKEGEWWDHSEASSVLDNVKDGWRRWWVPEES